MASIGLAGGHWLILAVAGSDYLPAYWPMIVLAAAASLELVSASLEALLVARGRAIANFLIRAVPLAAGLIALPWLLDWLGAAGAALVVLGASLVSVTGFALLARRTS